MEPIISFTEEVADALAQKKSVVALESTIIAHGMPWPQNLETAEKLEASVRGRGAVPATIAVLDGKVKVGLSRQELERIASSKDVMKLSSRDLAVAVAKKQEGATTVASTLRVCVMAGIKVFATGGIGGVHRGAEHSFDVSADLIELSRCPVAVVCAGCKSILDIPKTLEYLETMGVAVVGYGTDEFPAFFSRSSGEKTSGRCDSAREAALLIQAARLSKLPSAILIANPAPAEAALENSYISGIIEEALLEAEKQGIRGKDVTPFLLAAIVAKTEGRSLKTNIALAVNNASVAASIAAELSALHNS